MDNCCQSLYHNDMSCFPMTEKIISKVKSDIKDADDNVEGNQLWHQPFLERPEYILQLDDWFQPSSQTLIRRIVSSSSKSCFPVELMTTKIIIALNQFKGYLLPHIKNCSLSKCKLLPLLATYMTIWLENLLFIELLLFVWMICLLDKLIFRYGNYTKWTILEHISKWIHYGKQTIYDEHIQLTYYLLPSQVVYNDDDLASRASTCFCYSSCLMSINEPTSPDYWYTALNNAIKSSTYKGIAASRLQPRPRKQCDQWKSLAKIVIIIMTILSTINQFDMCDAKVKIHQIIVPKYIENGTMDSVLLDCQYSLDSETDRNLVVKWFFKEDPEPIYQWIVEHDLRRVPQRYQGRVDLNYEVLNQTEPWQRYRSLNLIRPTVEMTGRYSCHVISITSEAHDSDTMIVYAKTKSIDLVTRRVTRQRSAALKSTGSSSPNNWSTISSNNSRTSHNGIQPDRHHQSDHPGYETSSSSAAAGFSSSRLFEGKLSASSSIKPNQNHLPISREHRGHAVAVTEIECSVENVYPLPELTIYQVLGDGGPNTQRPRSLEKARVQQNSTQLTNGAFRVSMIVSIDDEDLLMMSGSGDGSNSEHMATNMEHQVAKPTTFECLVAQDELKHELRKSTVFVPNIVRSRWNESDSNGFNGLLYWTTTVVSIMVIRVIIKC